VSCASIGCLDEVDPLDPEGFCPPCRREVDVILGAARARRPHEHAQPTYLSKPVPRGFPTELLDANRMAHDVWASFASRVGTTNLFSVPFENLSVDVAGAFIEAVKAQVVERYVLALSSAAAPAPSESTGRASGRACYGCQRNKATVGHLCSECVGSAP
jgi:hypothetical protein